MRLLTLALVLIAAPAQDKARPTANPIDRHLEAAWERDGKGPAGPCDDATFLRRVSLDLTGRLPRPDEIRAFLKSAKKDKRSAKIEELLASPDAADYFAHLWLLWLTGHDITLQDRFRIDFGALIRWLRDAWERNLPYDQLVEAFLTAQGKVAEDPPAAFRAKHLKAGEPPVALAVRSARLFLGRDIRCAQCHDHPFEAMTQEEFWGYAAFFRPGPMRQGSMLRNDLGELPEVFRFLDGRGPEEGESPGRAAARLTLTMKDDAAARAIVDRIWTLYFGRSLAPSRGSKGRPDLLASFARDFVEGGWNLRQLTRSIVTSRLYQMESAGPEEDRRDYRAGPLKMMNQVQFLRAYVLAFRLEPIFEEQYRIDPAKAGLPDDADTMWLGLLMYAKDLLVPKGRDPEETVAVGTDRMALKLMNNVDLQMMMLSRHGLPDKVIREKPDAVSRVDELFLLLVSRPPTKTERQGYGDFLRAFENPYEGAADLFWVLLNSAEFVFVS